MTVVKNGKRYELTPKQNRFLEFIHCFQIQNGYSPTQAEIAKGLGFKSLNSVQNYLNILKEKGALEKEKDSRREVSITRDLFSKFAAVAKLPLLGKVAAGRPIEAVENSDKIEVPSHFIKPGFNHFVLKVQGNSMIEDHICDGDFIVVRQQESAENGETIVALIDNEATLKRFQKRKGRIELHPANSDFKPIFVGSDQHFRIAGVMTGLIRSLH